MKMAKASEADLRMAMDLCSAFDLLGHRFLPCMPETIEQLGADEEREPFDCDDDQQCGRALRHLLDIAERGSLMRVVWGMDTVLDPANAIVDPDADTLEIHPRLKATQAAQPEGREWIDGFALELLVAAGLVTQAKVAEARALAAKSLPPSTKV